MTEEWDNSNEPHEPEKKNNSNVIFNEYSHTAFSDLVHSGENADIDPLKWRITSIQVYSGNGDPIFDANYGSKLSKLDSGVVMMFFQALESFANENLATRLIDFKVGNERVIFKLSNNNLYLVTAIFGSKVRSGLSSYTFVTISNLITDISSNLFFLISDKDGVTHSIAEELNGMVNDVNANATEMDTGHLALNRLNISQAVISDEAGMPVLTRTFEGSNFKDDPMLFSMFLHSLNVFFSMNFSDELKEINFGNSRLYVKNFKGKFFAIMVQFDNFINLREDSPIHGIVANMLNKIATLVSNLGDDLDIIPEESLAQMIDNFIYKAQLNLNQDYADAVMTLRKNGNI